MCKACKLYYLGGKQCLLNNLDIVIWNNTKICQCKGKKDDKFNKAKIYDIGRIG